jgi:hypothetical protein
MFDSNAIIMEFPKDQLSDAFVMSLNLADYTNIFMEMDAYFRYTDLGRYLDVIAGGNKGGNWTGTISGTYQSILSVDIPLADVCNAGACTLTVYLRGRVTTYTGNTISAFFYPRQKTVVGGVTTYVYGYESTNALQLQPNRYSAFMELTYTRDTGVYSKGYVNFNNPTAVAAMTIKVWTPDVADKFDDFSVIGGRDTAVTPATAEFKADMSGGLNTRSATASVGVYTGGVMVIQPTKIMSVLLAVQRTHPMLCLGNACPNPASVLPASLLLALLAAALAILLL